MLGRLCPFCGLYIKFFQKGTHERWHAEHVTEVLKLLCPHCASEHGKVHHPCGKYPDCRCGCNVVAAGEES